MNELVLYGSVGMSWWDEPHFTAKDVREQIAGMSGPLTVRLNSGGGVATEGQAIFTALSEYPDEVTVLIDGAAASAASLIAMAGDKIVMRDGAFMLVHDPANPFSMNRGTEDDHRRTADHLAVLATGYARVYARRAGISVDQAREIMRAETLFDAPGAIAAGFATGSEDEPAAAAAAFDYRIYAHAPEAARRAAETLGRPAPAREAVLAMFAGRPRITEEVTMSDKTTVAEGKPVTIDSANTKDITMTTEAPAKPAVTAERARSRRITELFAQNGFDMSIATAMIEDGSSVEMAVDKILDMKRAAAGDDLPRMGVPTFGVGGSYDEGPGLRAKMIAGLTRRLDPAADTTGAPAQSLGDIAMTLARRAGHQPFNEAEAIRMAAHSTSDFPLILDGSMSNLVARRIETLAPAIQRAAHVVQRDDYRQGRSLHLSATAMPAEIKEGGEIKFVTADEKGELLPKLRDFGSGFNITNQAMVNDVTATGLLNDIANRMAEGAVGRFRAVLLEPLLANSGAGQTMADGNPLFHASHGNLAASGAAPDVTTLSNARTAMRRQTGLKGELLALEPWALIVPPELETAAEKLLADLAAAEVAEVNPFSGKLKLIVEPGLTDDGAWYLCADPSRFDGLAYAFLDGQSRPRVESRPAWSTLGMELRLAWALDAKFIATATWYRNPGA